MQKLILDAGMEKVHDPGGDEKINSYVGIWSTYSYTYTYSLVFFMQKLAKYHFFHVYI